jgi:hypothetical protein
MAPRRQLEILFKNFARRFLDFFYKQIHFLTSQESQLLQQKQRKTAENGYPGNNSISYKLNDCTSHLTLSLQASHPASQL